jgi:hypothetical protein
MTSTGVNDIKPGYAFALSWLSFTLRWLGVGGSRVLPPPWPSPDSGATQQFKAPA